MRSAAAQLTSTVRLLLVLLAAASTPAMALDFSYNGFADVTFGQILSGRHQPYLNDSCPCYVGNYEYGAIYDSERIEGNRESLLGLQGHLQILNPLSATVQAVARASTEKVTVDWAYLTYILDSNWNIQAGRKRLPLYYYSDSLYIGYSYPWVRTPTDVYGWEIFDYDGATINHSNYFGDWTLNESLYGGRRAVGYDLMESNIYYGYQVSEAWNKIIGGTVDFSDDIFGLRLIVQHNKIDFYSYDNGPQAPAVQSDFRSPQDIVGSAFTIDYAGFLWRSEANVFREPHDDFISYSYLAGAGYKWRKLTGMFTESWYYERITSADYDPERQDTHTATLRWDFHKSWAAKLQFDMFQDHSQFQFTGDARVLTLSIDAVF